MGKAAFFDRDGTLIHDPGYLGDPAGVHLLPHAAAALAACRRAGYLLFVISNQSGIARGYFDVAAVHAVNARMQALLVAHDPLATLDGVYFCPHGDADACPCRKPKPGLYLTAAQAHGIDLSQSLAIGDSPRDLQAAIAAGIPAARTRLLTAGLSLLDLLEDLRSSQAPII